VRIALTGVLDDPSLQILHSLPGDSQAWVDERGSPVDLDRATGVQRVTRVASGNRRIAILHDPSLSEHRALVISAGSYALAALENLSLTDDLANSIQDLAEPGPAGSRLNRMPVRRSNATSTTGPSNTLWPCASSSDSRPPPSSAGTRRVPRLSAL
jgi:hypothetical protein